MESRRILYNYTSDEKDGNGRYKNGFGLYYTVDRTDLSSTWKKSESVGVGKNYYYRGAVTNNYVKFAGALWQIIRIDERGNIRMIKETSTIQSKWNTETSATYKMKMTYMYGTSNSAPYANTYNSTIKLTLDDIYRKNFDSPLNQTWENFLADPGFCNNKSEDTSPATYYNSSSPYYIQTWYVSSSSTPTYKCATATDNYTTKTSSFGSKTANFNYPIGLITYDEVIFAGGKLNTANTSFYLDRPNGYWTMSPTSYTYSSCFYCGYLNVNSDGNLTETRDSYKASSSCTINSSYSSYVYPVIALKPTVLIESATANGTKENPYVVGPDTRTWVD